MKNSLLLLTIIVSCSTTLLGQSSPINIGSLTSGSSQSPINGDSLTNSSNTPGDSSATNQPPAIGSDDVNPYFIPTTPIPLNNITSPDFLIGSTLITVRQYCAFLNAVAKTGDPYGLFSPPTSNQKQNYYISCSGAIPFTYSYPEGTNAIVNIPVSGTTNSMFVYAGDCPVTYVSLFAAARFCNWMENGQPTNLPEGPGSTETGSYTLVTTNRYHSNDTIQLNSGAHWRLVSANEWAEALTPVSMPAASSSTNGPTASVFKSPAQDQYLWQWTDTYAHVYCGYMQTATDSTTRRNEGVYYSTFNGGTYTAFFDTGFRLVYFP